MDITVHVSTKGRYFTTLPLFLVSVANQTLRPKKVIIYDDNTPPTDLRQHPLYQYIFGLLDSKGIAWTVGFGEGKGQLLNHQRALKEAETEFLYRGDDDTVLSPNVLEVLASHMMPKVGAIAPLVLHPNQPVHNLPSHFSHNKIEFCEDPSQLNIQWFRHPDGIVKNVDHLYSTFLYRKSASTHGYNMNLSPVAHREESLFTYEMKVNGWDLLVVPQAEVNHFRYNEGGIRSSNIHTKENFDHDAQIFLDKLKEWGVVLKSKKLIVLDNGLGDHLVFKKILPDMLAKYKDLVIANCYNNVFEGDKVELISIHEAKLIGNIEQYNIYKFLWDNTDKHWSLEEAYRELYGVTGVKNAS